MLPYQNQIAVAAHRGNSRYYPENTMAAYRSALALQVDMIEMDVHMTRDGELVCMHDHRVDRTTNGDGLVREMTLEETPSSLPSSKVEKPSCCRFSLKNSWNCGVNSPVN